MKKYKILFADMDWCLISTKSGHLFPKGWDDYLVDKEVCSAIKKLKPEMVLIVSNQSGVDDKSQPKKYIAKSDFDKRINAISKEITDLTGVKVFSTYCPSGDKTNRRRKPNPGMLEDMAKEHCPEIDKTDMVMIGDASGLEGDWADTDKKAAKNFGIDYIDVDEFAGRPHRDEKFKDIEESLKDIKSNSLEEYIQLYENFIE